jgi:DhnA family fructose-bisphosphate aldolase class Ia
VAIGAASLQHNLPFMAVDGRSVIVALDHSLAAGQIPPLDRPRPLLERVLAGNPDGLIVTPGMARLLPSNSPPWLLTADYYGTSVLPGGFGDEELHCRLWDAEQAAESGAAALKCLLVFGFRSSDKQLANIEVVARLITEAKARKLPVMVEVTLWGGRVAVSQRNDGTMVAHAARMAFELGADIIKLPLPDDLRPLSTLAAAIPVPLLLMGGPASDPTVLFPLLRDAMDAGVRGVALGRNVWQHPKPDRVVVALNRLVHEDCSAEEALEVLDADASTTRNG